MKPLQFSPRFPSRCSRRADGSLSPEIRGVEDILERFRVELDVLTSVSVIALEAREND
jgi:hypothetical protein